MKNNFSFLNVNLIYLIINMYSIYIIRVYLFILLDMLYPSKIRLIHNIKIYLIKIWWIYDITNYYTILSTIRLFI